MAHRAHRAQAIGSAHWAPTKRFTDVGRPAEEGKLSTSAAVLGSNVNDRPFHRGRLQWANQWAVPLGNPPCLEPVVGTTGPGLRLSRTVNLGGELDDRYASPGKQGCQMAPKPGGKGH